MTVPSKRPERPPSADEPVLPTAYMDSSGGVVPLRPVPWVEETPGRKPPLFADPLEDEPRVPCCGGRESQCSCVPVVSPARPPLVERAGGLTAGACMPEERGRAVGDLGGLSVLEQEIILARRQLLAARGQDRASPTARRVEKTTSVSLSGSAVLVGAALGRDRTMGRSGSKGPSKFPDDAGEGPTSGCQGRVRLSSHDLRGQVSDLDCR